MTVCSGDPALALACGIDDVEGERRVRERDRGHVLAASSTLNRLELSKPGEASRHRYKKIVADHEAHWTVFLWTSSWRAMRNLPERSSWTSMPPTIRSMGTRKANTSMVAFVYAEPPEPTDFFEQ